MEVHLFVKVWVSKEIDAETFEIALERAKQMKVEEFLKTRGFLVNNSSVTVIGVLDNKNGGPI